ncbi:heterokaryon incompatibility protein-domain-containing protein [Dendryphion nanum]|uniref:Heterokaryon incompatibility protein-domain-containing protein n=1 Tax=Dendryphion nanum TaxID=256645 RepID=A0A9P9IT51_9PLEO|nr:heterokaryon incompatibility protein-domain-containing protein [Dendryphion nanum]
MKSYYSITSDKICQVASNIEEQVHELESYIYDKLKSEKSIRVLELCPGRSDDIIQCRLRDVELNEKLQYKALSYTWGSLTDKSYVLCHRKKVEIPTNLYEFLRRLRDPTQVRHLWADSICINQSDLKERGYQVSKMALIYTTAQEVLIWLGTEDPFSYLASDLDVCDEAVFMLPSRDPRREVNKTITPCWDTPLKLSEQAKSFWTAYAKISRRDWFTRIWVIQEAGLARKATFVIGQRLINFQRFLDVQFELGKSALNVIEQFGIDFHDNLFRSFSGKLSISNEYGTCDFLELLSYSSDKKASDPRDHVFALLGHPSATLNGLSIIEPDYERSCTEIFHDIAVKIIQETMNLRILSAANSFKIDDRNDTLPSWAPRWDQNLELALELANLVQCFAGVFNEATDAQRQNQSDFAAFRLYLVGKTDVSKRAELIRFLLPEGLEAAHNEANGGRIDGFFKLVQRGMWNKRLFTTKRGFLGNGPAMLQTGDVCCILFGNCCPMILRPEGSRYRVVGEAYIKEVMKGEAVFEFLRHATYTEQTFELI